MDDEAFVQLNDLLHRVQQARAAVGSVRQRARQVLPRTGRLLSYLRGLPVLHLELSDSGPGRTIAAVMSERRGLLPNTMAVAVLELPERPEAYLVGRSRQAVRTGVNHARREGLSVVRVTDDEERRARALELVDGKVTPDFGSPLKTWAVAPIDESWFVVDASGRTLAVAILAVDGPVARLNAVISGGGHLQSHVRYLLSAQVFMDLIGSGVSHVILEGALFLPPGLLHFQRLLGFRPMNVRLCRPEGGSIGDLVARGFDRSACSVPPDRRAVPAG